MSELIETKSSTLDFSPSLRKEGRTILRKNKNMRDMVNVMEDKKFRDFFDASFGTMADAKTAIMMMKLYQYIDQKFPSASPEEKAAIIKRLYSDRDFRGQIIKAITA